jgi:uncharacterized membrane protein
VLAPAIISHPGGTTVEVEGGAAFTLSHRLRWDEEARGYYTVTLYWTYGGDQSWNFTFVEASAYFVTGPYAGQSIEATVDIDDDGSMVSMTVGAYAGDPRDGEFNVDITFRASGTDGTPHRPGDHPISYSRIRCNEAKTVDDKPADVTIRVLPTYKVETSISPGYASAPAGATLSYTVTVTNLGNTDDIYDLRVDDNEGWSPTIEPTSLIVPVGGKNRATLSVTIPDGAAPCTEDNITVKVTSRARPDVSSRASCIAHVTARGVSISISPFFLKGLAGETLAYEVMVKNTGQVHDNYNLTARDDAGWTLTLSENKFLNVPPGENRTAMLNVAIPIDATPFTEDNVIVAAISEDGLVSASARCVARVNPLRGVEVKIFPSYKSGMPSSDLEYVVAVVNKGLENDNYILIAGDDAGWELRLSENLLSIPATARNNVGYENRMTTLTVSIPPNAVPCTRDNVTVAATSMENVEIKASANCIAHALIAGVEVSISPPRKTALPGATLSYLVVVKNTGNNPDNYNLSVIDDAGWNPTLSENLLTNIPPGESRGVNLFVKIPNDAVPCTEDNIWVIAISQIDNTVSDNASCIAHAAFSGPAIIYYPRDTIEVDQGRTFVLSHRLRWDEEARGYYTVTLYWTYGGDQSWNFTFVEARAYFVTGPYAGQSIEATVNIDDDGNMVSMTVGAYAGDPRDGEFNVDITFRASGADGTPHRPGDHPISYSRIRCYEYSTIDAIPSPITVRMPPRFVLVWPSHRSGAPGAELTYTTTVTNLGAVGGTFDLKASDALGWKLRLEPTYLVLSPGESGTATLYVAIPSDAAPGTVDRITVGAALRGNPEVGGSDRCVAGVAAAMKIVPIEDSYVRQDTPGGNWGDMTSVYVGRYLGGAERAFFKFDLSTIPGASITEARYYNLCWALSGANYAKVQIHAVEDDSWREREITWNNQPELGPILDGPYLVNVINKWFSWDITDFVAREFAGDKMVSIAMVDADENVEPDHAARFEAREYSIQPYLEVYYTVPLEPRPSVSISISPAFQKGLAGENLTYAVTVVNEGNAEDTFTISVWDNEGWKVLNPRKLTLGIGETGVFWVQAKIPENAVVGTANVITVTATSQTDNSVSKSASAVARVDPARRVMINIWPNQISGPAGGSIGYVVTATNLGIMDDIYNLTIATENGWGASISPSSLAVPASPRDDPSYRSASATLSVAIPPGAENSAMDRITVTATSRENAAISNSASCTAQAFITGVGISVSPGYRSGLPGSTLSYSVIVTNTGWILDTFDLSASDGAGWGLTVSPASLTLAPGESGNATLSVVIPPDALGCTKDGIRVTATSRADPRASASASTSAHATIVRGVEVSISPSSASGAPGATLSYKITVTNLGNAEDTFALEISGGVGWSPRASSTSLTIGARGVGSVTLSVTIPTGAAEGATTTITVTATSTSDPGVSSSASCRATAVGVSPPAMGPTGPAMEEIRRSVGVPSAGVTVPVAAPPTVPLATSMIAVVIAAFLAGYLLYRPGGGSPPEKPKERRRGKRQVLASI